MAMRIDKTHTALIVHCTCLDYGLARRALDGGLLLGVFLDGPTSSPEVVNGDN